MADTIYQAELDDSDVLKTLKNIDANIQDLARKGDRHFKSIGDSAQSSGVKIGAVAGVVASVTSAFIDAGKAAVSFFSDVVKNSVDAAKEIDTATASLTGIFGGDSVAAEAALDRIQKKSREIGVDLTELAGAFLPQVGSLAEFERVAEIAAGLARSDPGQGALGARIALQEALSGDLQSLRRRFELPAESIDRIKQLQEELGDTEGLIVGLEAELQRLGKDLETLGGTAETSFARVQLQGQRFSAAFGGPVLESLQTQFDELGNILDERGDDFELIADAFGRVVANVVDFVGSGLTDFLANLDTEQAIELAENLFDMVDNARTLVETLGLLELPGEIIEDVNFLVDGLNEVLDTAIKITALRKAQEARLKAETEATRQFIDDQELVSSALGGFASFDLTDEQKTAAAEAGQAAFNDQLSETLELLEESSRRQEDNKEATDRLREAQQESSKAGEELADAFLAQKQAARDAAAAEIELAAALETLSEKLIKIDVEVSRKRADALAQANRQRSKLERNFSRSREKDERALQRRLSQLEEEGADERSEKALKIATDASQKRIDIETDFRRELADINRRFDQDALDAELNRDALAFIRSERQRQRAIDQATVQRGERVQDVNTEEQRQQAELLSLDDALAKKLEKERENFRIRREEAEIANRQRLEDVDLNFQEQQAKIDEFERRKLDDLQRASQEELRIIEETTGAQIDLVTERQQLMTLITQRESANRIKALEDEAKRIEDLSRRVQSRIPAGRRRQATNLSRALAQSGPQFQFQEGGVVPGPVGSPQLAVVHGGETILPTHQASPVPLPPGINNFNSQVDNSIRIDQFTAGGGSVMDRFVTQRQMLEFFQRLR